MESSSQSKKKALHKKGFLTKEAAIRVDVEVKLYNGRRHSVKKYVFNCLGCLAEIKLLSGSLKTHTGRCESCCQRGRPFEAAYNELCNRRYRHGHSVDLTYEDFLLLTKIDKCHYCMTSIVWEPYTKNKGRDVPHSRSYKLDRKDNARGYSKDNVVVCCWDCNAAKSSTYTYADFLEMTRVFRARAINAAPITAPEYNAEEHRREVMLKSIEGNDYER